MSDFECIIWKVEHGSAAFLKTPNDRTVMFDAGCSDDFSPANWLKQKYKFNSDSNRLDYLVISHPDRDHIRDLPDVHTLLNPGTLSRNKKIPTDVIYPSGTKDLQEPLKTYKEMNEKYIYGPAEYNKYLPISNWGNVRFAVFSCSPDHIPDCPKDRMKNNLSLLTYIKYRDTEIVFPGDLEPIGWKALIKSTSVTDLVGSSDCRILIAPHHGRRSGLYYKEGDREYIYDDFLKIMKPNLVIMSDKWGNETTDPDSYRPYVANDGWPVISKSRQIESKKVITTKINNYVRISVSGNNRTPAIKIN
jgi:competence protein ComEC